MTNKKISFDEFAKTAKTLKKEDQLKTLGGRRNRGGSSSWSGDRGGIIEDDLIIRLNSTLFIKKR